MGWRPGDRVRHEDWGPGEIVAKLVLDRVRVAFDRYPGLPRTVRGSELAAEREARPARAAGAASARLVRAVPAGIAPRPAAKRLPAPAATRDEPEPSPHRPEVSIGFAPEDAWQTIEALRLGVVPARGVREYTVAREAELADLDALFASGAGCRFVWGDYGAGKTHMLDAAEQLGLERGYAVARLTLDPREHALHKPLRLYRSIMGAVRTADQVSPGFEAVIDRLKDSPDHASPGGSAFSRFFSPYLFALGRGDDEAAGWLRDYLRGDNIEADEVNAVLARLGWRGPRVLRMSDFRTFGRMYVHLLGTLACWAADAGTRGLLLLFDEVERADALQPADQRYAFEVLRHYAAVTVEPADLAFDPEDLYKGGHAVHRALPLRFRERQPWITVFALTPLEEIEAAFREMTGSSAYDLRLGPLERGLLRELVERVARIYALAFPRHAVSPDVQREIVARLEAEQGDGHDSFREAVRAAVLLLDADRLRRPARAS